MGRTRWLIMAGLLFLAWSGLPPAAARGGEPFPPMYVGPRPFLAAIGHTRAAPLSQKITGLTIPHHLLAADLMAASLARVSTQGYRRIIILSPDHFSRSRTPFAVARRDFHTVLGPVAVDTAAVGHLLENPLVSASNLFSHEHGVRAVLPLVAYYFPRARVVALALRTSASPAQWRQLAKSLEPLLTPESLIIQSTDFSHYLAAAGARGRDQETLRVISGGDPEAVVALKEPEHLDSRAAQYLQMYLQRRVFRARPTVVANRNSQAYAAAPLARTTSYIVQLYSPEDLPPQTAAGAGEGGHWFFGGDTFLGRYLAPRLADPAYRRRLTARVLKVTGGAPLIVNLEGVVMAACPPAVGPYDLCMASGITLPLLRRLRVRAVSLANNHSRDFGPEAYGRMVAALKAAGITAVEQGRVVDFRRFRLAAFTDVDNRSPGKIARLRPEDLRVLKGLPRDKPLFALLHWGQEYEPAPGPREQDIIKALTARGVELIIGSHPHGAAGLVGRPDHCLAFSLGNFIFDQSRPEVSGALLEVVFFSQGTYVLKMHPLGNLYVAVAGP